MCCRISTLLALVALALPCALSAAEDPTSSLVKAFESGDTEQFNSLARALSEDPWIVLDRLLRLKRRDVAQRLADVTDAPDASALRRHAARGEGSSQATFDLAESLLGDLRGGRTEAIVVQHGEAELALHSVAGLRAGLFVGIAAQKIKRPALATQWMRRVSAAARDLGWLRIENDALKSLGRLLRGTGTQDDVARVFARRGHIEARLGRPQRAARLLHDAAGFFLYSGDTGRSATILEEAYVAFKALQQRPEAAKAALNAALVLARRGEYAPARDWMDRAEADVDTSGADALEDDIAELRAAIGAETGDFLAAIAYHEARLEGLDEKTSAPDRAAAIVRLAYSKDLAGKHEAARGDLDRALQLMGPSDADKALRGEILRRRGAVRLALKDHSGALSDLIAARSLIEKDPLASGRTHLDMARALLASGTPVRARKALASARAAFDRIGAWDFLAEAEIETARLAYETKADAEAVQATVRAYDALERVVDGLADEPMARTRARRAGFHTWGLRAARRSKDVESAVAILERSRGRSLLAAWGGRDRLRGVGLPAELGLADDEARARLYRAHRAYRSHAATRQTEATRAARGELLAAEGVVQDMKQRIQRNARRVALLTAPVPASVKAIRHLLSPAEAFAWFVTLEGRFAALVLTSQGADWLDLGSVGPIRERHSTFEDYVAMRDPRASTVLAELGDMLVRPLETVVPGRDLVLCPEDTLCLAPWPALIPARNATCVASASVWVALRREPSRTGKDILAIGNPAYGRTSSRPVSMYFRGRTLPPLDGAEEEVRRIAGRPHDVRLLGARATERALREALPKRPHWRSIHFACHGLIDRNAPGLSALALSDDGEDDGFLSVVEILDMRLSSDLVALSACDSGRGELLGGAGVLGFTRAFMIAGTPRVLASLWKVDDEATRVLMTEFYETWRPGTSVAAALRRAQEHIRSHAQWKHPAYWAAWVPWGACNEGDRNAEKR